MDASTLTAREVEILDKLANGYTSREIANDLGTTENYLKNLMRKIRDKVGADTSAQAVAMAVRRKIIE